MNQPSDISRRVLAFAAIVLPFPLGCGDAHSTHADRLAVCTSRAEMESIVSELRGAQLSETALRKLVSGWGAHGPIYDEGIVRFIGNIDRASDEEMYAVTLRLTEDPTLLRQVFWHERWNGYLSTESQPVLVTLRDHFKSRNAEDIAGSRGSYFLLLLVASTLDEPKLVIGAHSGDLHSRWEEALTLLKSAEFYAFYAEAQVFRLDEKAHALGQTVSVEKQLFTRPDCPVPGAPAVTPPGDY
jgi:hypothetical protein